MESKKGYKVRTFTCYHCMKKQSRVSGSVRMCSNESEILFDMVLIESHLFVHSAIHLLLLITFGKYIFLSTCNFLSTRRKP